MVVPVAEWQYFLSFFYTLFPHPQLWTCIGIPTVSCLLVHWPDQNDLGSWGNPSGSCVASPQSPSLGRCRFESRKATAANHILFLILFPRPCSWAGANPVWLNQWLPKPSDADWHGPPCTDFTPGGTSLSTKDLTLPWVFPKDSEVLTGLYSPSQTPTQIPTAFISSSWEEAGGVPWPSLSDGLWTAQGDWEGYFCNFSNCFP